MQMMTATVEPLYCGHHWEFGTGLCVLIREVLTVFSFLKYHCVIYVVFCHDW